LKTLKYVSGSLFALSVVVLLSLRFVDLAPHFVYVAWIHVAIILLGFYSAWWHYKLRPHTLRDMTTAFLSLPRWLPIVLIPIAVATATLSNSKIFDDVRTPDGEEIHQMQWIEKDGRYFLFENRRPAREISVAEYKKFETGMVEVFASAWVLFSALLMLDGFYLESVERTKCTAT
jgi:hypothetical protein